MDTLDMIIFMIVEPEQNIALFGIQPGMFKFYFYAPDNTQFSW